jgi:uncharacterized membrane protein YvlD (DUF360 family)
LRFIAWIVVGLVTNAVALLVAAAVLDGFDIDAVAFPVVVIVFTLIGALAHPVIEAFIEKSVQLLASFVGLVAAFVTLLITDVVSDNLNISGIDTWILATLILWAASLLTSLLIGKRIYERISGQRAA